MREVLRVALSLEKRHLGTVRQRSFRRQETVSLGESVTSNKQCGHAVSLDGYVQAACKAFRLCFRVRLRQPPPTTTSAPDAGFVDVDPSSIHKADIDCLLDSSWPVRHEMVWGAVGRFITDSL